MSKGEGASTVVRPARGASGFRGPDGHEPLGSTDRAAFRRACFETARGIGARVAEPPLAGVAAFHAITLTTRAASHTVLCHAHLPVVAFTVTPPAPGNVWDFVDPPDWARGFEAAGFQVLTARRLGTPMSRVDVGDLSLAELVQVRYWLPEVLGDLLFNWWD